MNSPHSRLHTGIPGYEGDLYDPALDTTGIVVRANELIRSTFPGTRALVSAHRHASGRSIDASVVAHHQDLSDGTIRRDLLDRIRGQIERLGWDRSDHSTDLVSRHFALTVEVHPDYWSERQAALAGLPAGSSLSPSAFMKNLQTGHILEEAGGPLLGRRYVVGDVTARGFTTSAGIQGAPDIFWHRPRAAALRAVGFRIRLSEGTEKEPDRHRILLWRK